MEEAEKENERLLAETEKLESEIAGWEKAIERASDSSPGWWDPRSDRKIWKKNKHS